MARFLLAWLVLASVALLGGPGGSGAAESARVGREFKVRVGQVVTFGGESLRLRFREVAEDSRCPVGVACVWAGNAEVMLEVGGRRGGLKRTLKLNTNASSQKAGEGKYGRFTIKLVELNPRPSREGKIAAGGYTATLLVVKD
ncbi:MAG TPA: hypothetical protein VGX48_06270 [Pyrinomonadaceae bacterium]|jgi:hypothetical protein|nr:hypothetical protein [Pyrinomonadaceae bacterium]